ncbi:MAG: hypothetical protein WD055_05715 [Candidatus Dependentiae bacterium]
MMNMKKSNLFLLMVLLSPMGLVAQFCPEENCKQSCGRKASLEDLSSLPSENGNAYTRAKQLFSGDDKQSSLSLEDLEQALATAKEKNDFETHAEAYHRLKVELSTEDEGSTIVLKVKKIGIPVAIITGVVGVAAYLFRTYLNNNAAESAYVAD